MDKFIDEYSKRPNICLGPIEIIDKSLGTHIDWAANSNIFEDLIGFDSEAKVTKLVSVLMDKDIGNFQITVDNTQIRKISQCLVNTKNNFIDGFLAKTMMIFDELIEIASLAELGDNIAIVNTGVNIQTFDNIGMMHDLQNGNFAF